jgi:hypothetical protein
VYNDWRSRFIREKSVMGDLQISLPICKSAGASLMPLIPRSLLFSACILVFNTCPSKKSAKGHIDTGMS